MTYILNLNLPTVTTKINSNLFHKKEVDVFVKRDDLIHNIISGDPLVGDNVEKWLGQMCSFPVNYDDPIKLKSKLINDYQIEIPVMAWNDKTLMRISLNGYNSSKDVDKLLDVLKKIIL